MLENRKEFKYFVPENEDSKLILKIEQNCQEIYKKRAINSIYLDTVDFSIFKNNLERDSETVKYRFRFYDKNIQNNKFEKKININGTKFKLTNTEYFYRQNNIGPYMIDNLILYPKALVRFDRSYYKYKNTRVTVDKNLEFVKPIMHDLNEFRIKQNIIIIEQKILNSNDDSIEKNLLFPQRKYSKFIESFKALYPLQMWEDRASIQSSRVCRGNRNGQIFFLFVYEEQ